MAMTLKEFKKSTFKNTYLLQRDKDRKRSRESP